MGAHAPASYAMIPVSTKPIEVQAMALNFSTIDLASVTATEDAITNALQNHVTQWEQDAQDAILKGDLVCAQQFQNWAFAADLLSKTVNIEISVLIGKIINARFGDGSGRSVAEQILDDLAIQVASAQEENLEVLSM